MSKSQQIKDLTHKLRVAELALAGVRGLELLRIQQEGVNARAAIEAAAKIAALAKLQASLDEGLIPIRDLRHLIMQDRTTNQSKGVIVTTMELRVHHRDDRDRAIFDSIIDSKWDDK